MTPAARHVSCRRSSSNPVPIHLSLISSFLVLHESRHHLSHFFISCSSRVTAPRAEMPRQMPDDRAGNTTSPSWPQSRVRDGVFPGRGGLRPSDSSPTAASCARLCLDRPCRQALRRCWGQSPVAQAVSLGALDLSSPWSSLARCPRIEACRYALHQVHRN